MTDVHFDVSVSPMSQPGRTIKFTPERMQQIRNLVERGMGKQEIAEMIGVTVGSLQVTCSRAGISLRRLNNIRLSSNGPQPKNDRPAPKNEAPEQLIQKGKPANLILRLKHGDRVRDMELPIPVDVIFALAFAANMRGMTISDFIASLIIDGMDKLEK